MVSNLLAHHSIVTFLWANIMNLTTAGTTKKLQLVNMVYVRSGLCTFLSMHVMLSPNNVVLMFIVQIVKIITFHFMKFMENLQLYQEILGLSNVQANNLHI